VLEVTELQDRDPATQEGKVWPNGDPVMVYAVNCEPEKPQDYDGESIVTLWVRSNMVTAFRNAAKLARVRSLTELYGATIDVHHTGLGEAKRGLNPAKLYQVTLTPGTRPMPAPDDAAEEPF
jgi:hypothetical protein